MIMMKTRSQRTQLKSQKLSGSHTIMKLKKCYIDTLPEEVVCKILSYLSLADLCKMNYMSKKWQKAVTHFLRYCTTISFADPDNMQVSYASAMRDRELSALLDKCRMVKEIKRFYPAEISGINHNPRVLTLSNISAALLKLPNLRTVDISNLLLMSELRAAMPQLQMPVFKNTNGVFPRDRSFPNQWLNCPSAIQEIELFGISLHHLPYGLRITKLHLQNVKFMNGLTRMPGAGRTFLPNLQSFMMNDCEWPEAGLEQTNTALYAGLASCRHLEVLHLTRSNIQPRLIRRIIEANWNRCKPFSKLKKLVLAANWTLHEDDIGAILIASQATLERIYLQKSLSRDMLMQALETSEVRFPCLQVLKLGYVDELSPRGNDTAQESRDFQPTDMPDDRPSQLSDYGLQMAVETFDSPHLNSVCINDCPFLNSPVTWLSDKALLLWERLTEFTLSQCPTTSLDEFNSLLSKLKSLKILNLVAVFPAPPKGCSRVGLSAGMNIGGVTGIRAIISQPPAATAASLLSIPDLEAAEVQELFNSGKLSDSDTEDMMEFANPADGYRSTQVHTSCMVSTRKMRRAHIRSRAQEQLVADSSKTLGKNRVSSLKSLRGKQRAKRDREGNSHLTWRRRQENPKMVGDEQQSEDINEPQHLIDTSLPGQQLDADNTTNCGRETSNQVERQENTIAKNTTCKPKQPVDVKQPFGTSRLSPAVSSDFWEDNSYLRHCRCCGCLLEFPLSSAGSLQFFPTHQKEFLSTREMAKTCIKCIKKQCQTAKKHPSYPTVETLQPRQSSEDDVKAWHLFDSSSGYSRLCTYKQGCLHSSRQNLKGKALLKGSSIKKHNVTERDLTVAAVDESKGAISKRGKAYLAKGKAPLNPSVAQRVKTSYKGRGVVIQRDSCKGQKRAGPGQGREVNTKKPRIPETADKETHTKDPFIEFDIDQVLRLNNAKSKITNINISNCGFTRLDLSNGHFLVALTAHACPSLHTMRFSSNPSVAPYLVRITQCPKMPLSRLVSFFNDKHLTCDVFSSSYVRTIEYEPMQQYDREDALIEMSMLPEVNKVLVECHDLTAEYKCLKLKTFYESLLKDMTRAGSAGYKSEKDFKIYTDEEYGKKIIVSHNIPSCSTKITPRCNSPLNCLVTSQHGHQLQGCSVLCFVHPIDKGSEHACSA
ncbi:F-box only protein 38-like [Watersipora subatra]|uniref:F-box only protein 38-like n=1 Tax=Watersipora subatra TaxID=2589382 RepID=UPI00355B93B1